MIQFDEVSLAFAGHTLFEKASFTLQKGERCGLVGRNGSGKSTLFKLINRELEPDQGNIIIPKHYRLGYLKQHINFTEKTLLEEAALGLPKEDQDQLYKAEKILFGLGFSETDLEKSPLSFSGGYQLRLNLAKVILSEPDCLLLDEPTNYLDIVSIRWLTSFLKRWQGELILISHDRDFMDKVTTHIMGIHRQSLKKLKGSTINFFEKIYLDEELHEKNRLKSEKKREHLQSFVDRFGAKASKASQAQSKQKILDKEPILEKLNQLAELSFQFQEAPFPGRKMLEAKDISFAYTNAPLIEQFSIEIEKQDKIAIIGKNGRGKSTLLKLISSELTPITGSLTLSDNTKIGYFGQTHVDRLNAAHTIEEELALSNPTLKFTEVKAIAGNMMFSGDLSSKKISILSGGEKSRVLLGKIIARPCNLLLLDEPTHHLDIESIEALIDALENFSGAVVIVTHSELILQRLKPNKIVICEEAKQTLFLGDYENFLEKIGWQDEKKDNPAPAKHQIAPSLKRASVLKPIERQIESFEKKLKTKEEEQTQLLSLIEAGDTSKELLLKMSLCQSELEALEAELYKLYELHAETSLKFQN
jgi:ATP-binding cassette, subfamily F, member 3